MATKNSPLATKNPTTTASSRLKKLSPAELADEAGRLHDELDMVKSEAIRRGLDRAEGSAWRITLSPPGEQMRADKPRLLGVLGISPAEFAVRFCHRVRTDWRLTITRRKPLRAAA
jgi:hypothetical protein